MRRIVLAIFASLGLVYYGLVTSAWETRSFRTANGQLVEPGMTRADVRRHAGAPLERKEIERIRQESPISAVKKKGEVWMYKGGDGYYSIYFRGDRVVAIEVIPFRGR